MNHIFVPKFSTLSICFQDMGAKSRFWAKMYRVEGVDYLHNVKHTVIPDNMEAITWAIASVITNGYRDYQFPFKHLEIPANIFESGMKYYMGENSLIVRGGTPILLRSAQDLIRHQFRYATPICRLWCSQR